MAEERTEQGSTEQEVAALARALGLAALHARFPGELAAALAARAKQAGALPRPENPAIEPTPAFRPAAA